tara:strand:- start:1011 stop:1181 length:171 start_codon:yes stop_codon:yes gene_type:complete
MAKTSKYASKMKAGKKMKNDKNTKYSSKMRGGRTSKQSKMTPTFNEVIKKKTGGKV